MPEAGKPAVTVILVSWNAIDHLEPCLRALESSGHEVVVVDNASADGSAELVRSRFPQVRLLAEARNLGFAGGVNAGVRATTSRHVMLLNPDAIPSRGAIDQLAAFLDEHPQAAAAAGQLQYPDGTPQQGWNVRRFPTLASLAASLLLFDRLWPRNPATRRYQHLDVPYDSPSEIDQPAAACLMVRRQAFEAVDGMDERFFPAWFEDVDFCKRLRAAGWSIFFVPGALFTHAGGISRQRLGPVIFQQVWHRNLERYIRKHHGPLALLAVRGLIMIGMGMRLAASVAAGRRTDAAAYAAVLWQTLACQPGPAGRLARGPQSG